MKLKLINKKEIAQGVWEIGFDIRNKNFSFKAGQYVRLVLLNSDIDDTKGPARLFSISSSPNNKEQLDITFRISESGYKKTLASMPIGAEAEFEGPWGRFVLPKNTETPIMFVAGGTGITPFLSMMRFATEEKLPYAITLLYASRDKHSIAYLSELKKLVKLNSKLKIHFVAGLIDEKLIRKNYQKNSDAPFYISGPPAMVDYVRNIFQDIKAPEENIYYEEWCSVDLLRASIKNILDISTDAVFFTDLAGIIKYVNPAWEQLSGWKAEEVVEKHTPRIQKSGKQDAEFYKEIWNYHINGKVYKHDVINKRKDGTLYEIDHLYLPIFSTARQIVGFAAFQREISEEKIREYKQNKAILESIGEGVAVADMSGKLTFLNEASEKISGVRPTEGGPKIWAETFGLFEEDGITKMPTARIPLVRALGGENVDNFNLFMRNQAIAKGKYLRVTARPIKNQANEVIGGVAVFGDITREKEIDKAKTEFISIASHQLKTPLTAINWIVERLNSGKVGKFTKKQKDYLGDVYDSSKRMAKLVDDLLSVSRLEEGKIKIEAKPLQLEDIIQKVIAAHKFLGAKKQCQIIFDKPKEKFPPVSIDEFLIRQIAGNLLTNSVRYSKDSCRIEVKLEKKDNNFLLTISDEGIGIPKDKQHHIFNKFFRTDNAQKLRPDGTGLGLYITTMIVE